MKNINLSCVMAFVLFCACSDSFQYDVYVKNSTGEDITVEFKTMKDKRGPIEDTVELNDGAYTRIISTVDLASSDRGLMASSKQCHQVAEYVNAKLRGVESKLKWCDKKIHFVKEDLGQGVFTIEYINTDFVF